MLMREPMVLHQNEAWYGVYRAHRSKSCWPTRWILTKVKWQDPFLYHLHLHPKGLS